MVVILLTFARGDRDETSWHCIGPDNDSAGWEIGQLHVVVAGDLDELIGKRLFGGELICCHEGRMAMELAIGSIHDCFCDSTEAPACGAVLNGDLLAELGKFVTGS